MALYPCVRVSFDTQHKATHKGFKEIKNENFSDNLLYYIRVYCDYCDIADCFGFPNYWKL